VGHQASQYSTQRRRDSKEKNESYSKKNDPYPSSSCSNQSRGALGSDNSHTECEEGESDLHHERDNLHRLTMSDPYHQKGYPAVVVHWNKRVLEQQLTH
jgi:hypothetical protein